MLIAFFLIARIALVAVFAVAGIAKLLDQTGARNSLSQFGVPAFAVPIAALLLPLFELACAVALLTPAWTVWGAALALGLLLLFVIAIAVNMMLGRQPDCHCFGQLHSSPAGAATLIRNLLLAMLAGVLVWQRPEYIAMNEIWSGLSESGAAILVLAILFVAQTVIGVVALYQVLRQNGRILQRLEAIETKLGVGATPGAGAGGLVVGSDAPKFTLENLDGAMVSLDSLRSGGKPVLLLFSEPGCNACESILGDVAMWQRQHAERLLIVPISRGAVDLNREKSTAHQIANLLLQKDREVAQSYRVEQTPSAVVVKDGRVVTPTVAGPDAIRQIVHSWTRPPPLKQGERLPSIELRDLNGKAVDLATLASRRTLLLFWNPSCGFCRNMLSEVKAWEADKTHQSPELVVISTGSAEANREQGFKSRILLDGHFSAGGRFGARGTPGAVLIDAEGRVASDVKTGSEGVLELMEQRVAEMEGAGV